MPPLGGNPSLVDMELTDIVAFLRVVQKEARGPTSRPSLTSAAPLHAGSETQ
jgi:hypothetical protein